MRASRYRFEHSWHVDAAADAVLALLEDVPGYASWWPSVQAAGGRAAPDGREARLVVRAPAGYRIRITLREPERAAGARGAHAGQPDEASIELRAAIGGDLVGWCAWRVTPERGGARVDFRQEVEAVAPLLRWASPLLHGAFARQHAMVMRRAERSMRAALGR